MAEIEDGVDDIERKKGRIGLNAVWRPRI